MKNSSSGKRPLPRELAANPEILVLWVLVALAVAINRQEPGALGCCQIWGASVALGALWVALFPRYLQDGSPPDMVLKSLFLLVTGGGIVFAGWLRPAFAALGAPVLPERVVVPAWIWVIGGLTALSGLAGLIFCKRVAAALQSRSAAFIRMCAAVVALVAVLLVVIATRAGTELLRLDEIARQAGA